jgi:hypothetical protein
MQTTINKQSREYITKNPVRSSIGSIGYGTVNAVELAVEVIGTLRSANSLIHRQIRMADKESAIEEAELDAQLAKLTMATA